MILPILLKMKLNILIYFLVLTYVNDSAGLSELVDWDCNVDGNILNISIHYSNNVRVSKIAWQYKNTCGYTFSARLTPCVNTAAYQYNIFFNCYDKNNCSTLHMIMIVWRADVWSAMTFGFHFEDGVNKDLLITRDKCIELSKPSIVTTSATNHDTYEIPIITPNIGDSTNYDTAEELNVGHIVIAVMAVAVFVIAFCIVYWRRKKIRQWISNCTQLISNNRQDPTPAGVEMQALLEETFSKNLEDHNVKEKDTLAMECEFTIPNVHVCWQKDGEDIISGSRIQISSNNCSHKLEIADVTKDDAGTYTCVCGDKKTECTITVEGATFSKNLEDHNVKEKDTLAMECELTIPNVHVCWQKDGEDIISGSRIQISSNNCLHKLEIADVTMDNAGTYTCVCGDKKTECTITVEGAKFSKNLEDHNVKEKDTLVMECELTIPNVHVCWQKDGEDIISGSRIQISSNNCSHKLEIADVTKDDAGTYTCVCGDKKTECTITAKGNG